MSITNISIKIKQLVLLRLINNGESLIECKFEVWFMY